MDHDEQDKIESAREMFQVLMEIANILDTNLDPTALTYCIRLCENGVHPDVLAHVVMEMQSEVSKYNSKGRKG